MCRNVRISNLANMLNHSEETIKKYVKRIIKCGYEIEGSEEDKLRKKLFGLSTG